MATKDGLERHKGKNSKLDYVQFGHGTRQPVPTLHTIIHIPLHKHKPWVCVGIDGYLSVAPATEISDYQRLASIKNSTFLRK